MYRRNFPHLSYFVGCPQGKAYLLPSQTAARTIEEQELVSDNFLSASILLTVEKINRRILC